MTLSIAHNYLNFGNLISVTYYQRTSEDVFSNGFSIQNCKYTSTEKDSTDLVTTDLKIYYGGLIFWAPEVPAGFFAKRGDKILVHDTNLNQDILFDIIKVNIEGVTGAQRCTLQSSPTPFASLTVSSGTPVLNSPFFTCVSTGLEVVSGNCIAIDPNVVVTSGQAIPSSLSGVWQNENIVAGQNITIVGNTISVSGSLNNITQIYDSTSGFAINVQTRKLRYPWGALACDWNAGQWFDTSGLETLYMRERRAIMSGGNAGGVAFTWFDGLAGAGSGLTGLASGSIASGQIGVVHLSSGLVSGNYIPTQSGLTAGQNINIVSGQISVSGGLQNITQIYDVSSGQAINIATRKLKNLAGNLTVNWEANQLLDTSGFQAVNWGRRAAQCSGGSPDAFNWIAGLAGAGSGLTGLASGSIASGSLGGIHLSSGSITSGLIGVSAGTPNGTLFLRDDFTWQSTTAGSIASGQITSGLIGNGAVVSGSIASGQVGINQLAANAINAGLNIRVTSGNTITIANPMDAGLNLAANSLINVATITDSSNVNAINLNASLGRQYFDRSGTVTITLSNSGAIITLASGTVISGNIASGQIGLYHLASGLASGKYLTASQSGSWWQDYSGKTQLFINSSGLNVSGTIFVNLLYGLHDAFKSVDPSGRHLFDDSGIGSMDWRERWLLQDDFNAKVQWASGTGMLTDTMGTESFDWEARQMFDLNGETQLTADVSGMILNIASGSVVSGNIASGQIGLYHLASGLISGNYIPASASGLFGFSLTSGCINSGKIANSAVVSGSIASGQVGTPHLASGIYNPALQTISLTVQNLASSLQIVQMFTSNDGSLTLQQGGQILDGSGNIHATSYFGSLGSTGCVLSGNISSGQIGSPHIASGGVLSGNIGSGQIGLYHLASGLISGNYIPASSSGVFFPANASGIWSGMTWYSGSIASGQIGSPHIASGGVLSGNIASGQIGLYHLASGLISGNYIPASSSGVFFPANASGIWSGDLKASGQITSGAVIGSLGGGRFNIGSGTIGPNDMGSGSILSGAIASGQISTFHITSGGVLSGNIGSGQISTFKLAANSVQSGQLASGTPANLNCLYPTTREIISGGRAVAIDVSGHAWMAQSITSGRMPAIGYTVANALSGATIEVIMFGAASPASGLNNTDVGKPVFVNASGYCGNISGGFLSGGFGATTNISGALCQVIGWAIAPQTIFVSATPLATSGLIQDPFIIL